MSKDLKTSYMIIDGTLDVDGEAEIFTRQDSNWMSRDEAKQIVNHLTEIFAIDDDKDDEIERLRAEVKRLDGEFYDLSDLVDEFNEDMM